MHIQEDIQVQRRDSEAAVITEDRETIKQDPYREAIIQDLHELKRKEMKEEKQTNEQRLDTAAVEEHIEKAVFTGEEYQPYIIEQYEEFQQPEVFTQYTTARMMYNRCVQEMKGVHQAHFLNLLQPQQKPRSRDVSECSQESFPSNSTYDDHPMSEISDHPRSEISDQPHSEISDMSSLDLKQTRGGIFFAQTKRNESISSAEPVEQGRSTTYSESESGGDYEMEVHTPDVDEMVLDNQMIKKQAFSDSQSETSDFDTLDKIAQSYTESLQGQDHSFERYCEWLDSQHTIDKNSVSSMRSRSSGSSKGDIPHMVCDIDEKGASIDDMLVDTGPEQQHSIVSQFSTKEGEEIEKWESNGTTYSIFIFKKDEQGVEDLNEEIPPEVETFLREVERERYKHQEHEIIQSTQTTTSKMQRSQVLYSSQDSDFHGSEPGKPVHFYISSSNEFLDDPDVRSTSGGSIASYRISEEELRDLESRMPTIIDETIQDEEEEEEEDKQEQENEEHADFIEDASHLLEVPASNVNLDSSDASDEVFLPGDKVVYDSDASSIENDHDRQKSFDIEEEVDDILENIGEVETYSPSSTLSKAFSHPKRKRRHKLQRHIQPPDMHPIPSGGSNEGSKSSDQDASVEPDNILHEEDEIEQREIMYEMQMITRSLEEDTEEEEVTQPVPSPESMFEGVIETIPGTVNTSDWPSDHDEFLPKVIKGNKHSKKSPTDMFMYDFYHERLTQKRSSSLECMADDISIGKVSDVGSEDLEKTGELVPPVTQVMCCV